jgi:Putative MetA-pathway of phenol degradation
MNPMTQYQSGVDGHVDWGASVALGEALYIGAVDYFYNQLGRDSGPGARLGGFQSKVTAAGPQIGYALDLGVVQADLNLRGYKEFDAQNRPEGWNVWLIISLSKVRLRAPDWLAAALIAGLVSITAMPGAVPFLIVEDGALALRLANILQVCLLFAVSIALGG